MVLGETLTITHYVYIMNTFTKTQRSMKQAQGSLAIRSISFNMHQQGNEVMNIKVTQIAMTS